MGLLHSLTSFAITVPNDAKINAGTVGIQATPAADVLANGLTIVYYLAGVICIVVIIIAGITYVTSSGEASNITRAKNMVLYAVVGLVVIAVAFVITQFVIGRF